MEMESVQNYSMPSPEILLEDERTEKVPGYEAGIAEATTDGREASSRLS